MDAGSSSDTKTPAAPSMKPADVIDSLKSKTVSLGRESGFFVSTKNMNKAEKSLIRMATSESGPEYVAEAEKALEQIGFLKTQVKSAEQQLKTAQEDKDKAMAAHKTSLEELQRLRGDGPDSLPTLQKMTKEYRTQLDNLSKELGKAKIQTKVAGKGFDPDLVEAAKKHEEDLRSQLNAFQKERKEMDKKLHEAKIAVETQSQVAIDFQEALQSANQELARLKSKKALAMKNGPLPALDIQIKTPVVRSILGDKGLEWMKKIDLQTRENMRDYAHNLMQAANSNNATRGIGDLLHYVWTWMKTKSYAVRETLRPWIETIHSDFANGKVKALKFYREALEAVLKEFKLQKANTEKRYKGKKGWQINTLAALKTAVATASSLRERAAKTFSDTWKKVKGVFSKALNMLPFMRAPEDKTFVEDEILFDVEKHVNLVDLDQGADSESSAD